MKSRSRVLLGWVLAAASCATLAREVPADDPVAAAIASAKRPAADLEQDARRRPDEILGFLGVVPGLRVMDVFSAGGYYTELLARVVGPDGEVIAYNNPPYARFAEKGIAERYADGRLPNVRQITATLEDLELEPASLDAAIFVMSYHDLYWRPEDGTWPATDPGLLLGKIGAALKPGGVVVVQDHVARTGADPVDSVGRLHRIDPAIVKRDFLAAGFVPDGESAALAHPEDDHTRLVFDESVRGRTDQFLFRFRKPR